MQVVRLYPRNCSLTPLVSTFSHICSGSNPQFSSVFIKDDDEADAEGESARSFCASNRKPIGILHIHDCLKAGIS